ncbi:hypothetical protein KEM54_000458 [Ascosphaera aggregata]|nr:hypothetical protein KEM54_000458 [Ascosphaera aggregata]
MSIITIIRRAKLKRLALEDRERMLRSHELQDFEAAAAAAEAAAAALYGSDATFQDPAALAACVPSQQPLPVNSFHQFTSMPYGLHTDDIIQSPLFLQTCHGAGPAPALALAAGPSAGPGTSLGNDVAGSVGPPQPLYSFNVDSVADWEASYAPQQLLSMHEDELMMQGVRASETEIRGGDERSMSACDHQLSLQDRALSEELPVPWVDTNPVDCHHQHQQQQHPQSMLNLHQPSMMARPAGEWHSTLVRDAPCEAEI